MGFWMIWILVNPNPARANKRMLSDWFSAALQTIRKCERYTPASLICLLDLLNNMTSKTLTFSTHSNPRRNNIEQGLLMEKRFSGSPRWELIDADRGEYPRNDHDFHYSGIKVWRDVNNGTLVKEMYSSNRHGRINKLVFSVIPIWPEEIPNLKRVSRTQ